MIFLGNAFAINYQSYEHQNNILHSLTISNKKSMYYTYTYTMSAKSICIFFKTLFLERNH